MTLSSCGVVLGGAMLIALPRNPFPHRFLAPHRVADLEIDALKVMVISGAMDAAALAWQIAAIAFMAKPFDIEILLGTVRRLLARVPTAGAA